MTKQKQVGTEHMASAKALSLPISTKHSVEISHYLRYKNTNFAKRFLEDVIGLKRAVPFRRFKNNVGHKAGMAAGRFPQKAARQFLKLVKSAEANAQAKGLNTTNLKIIALISNKASIPATGGRSRAGTKRTHLEIRVKEGSEKKSKVTKAKDVKKIEPKKVEEKEEVAETVKEEVKKEETVKAPEQEQAPAETPVLNEESKSDAEKTSEEQSEQPKEETKEPATEEPKENNDQPSQEETKPEENKE